MQKFLLYKLGGRMIWKNSRNFSEKCGSKQHTYLGIFLWKISKKKFLTEHFEAVVPVLPTLLLVTAQICLGTVLFPGREQIGGLHKGGAGAEKKFFFGNFSETFFKHNVPQLKD